MALDRTLFEISLKESDQNREYWLNRPWLAARRSDVQSADILVVPWEDFREGAPALFPQGSADLVRELSQLGSLTFELAIDEDQYQEILLHSKQFRIPMMVVTMLAVPALAGMLGNLMSDAVKGNDTTDQVEMSLIIQGDHGRSVSLRYKGPPGRLAETLVAEAMRCFPDQSVAPALEPLPDGSSRPHP